MNECVLCVGKLFVTVPTPNVINKILIGLKWNKILIECYYREKRKEINQFRCVCVCVSVRN